MSAYLAGRIDGGPVPMDGSRMCARPAMPVAGSCRASATQEPSPTVISVDVAAGDGEVRDVDDDLDADSSAGWQGARSCEPPRHLEVVPRHRIVGRKRERALPRPNGLVALAAAIADVAQLQVHVAAEVRVRSARRACSTPARPRTARRDSAGRRRSCATAPATASSVTARSTAAAASS